MSGRFVARTDRPQSAARRRTARVFPWSVPAPPNNLAGAPPGHVRRIRRPYDWARNGI